MCARITANAIIGKSTVSCFVNQRPRDYSYGISGVHALRRNLKIQPTRLSWIMVLAAAKRKGAIYDPLNIALNAVKSSYIQLLYEFQRRYDGLLKKCIFLRVSDYNSVNACYFTALL
jgi:hypothetical protein